ncbi:MAG: CheR family methyltransferase [Promethearchaeota archaeon]
MVQTSRIKIDEKSFQALISLLKQKTGLNLGYYRRTFILRRIQARMIRINCNNLERYNKYLLSNVNELKRFVESFNINYTYFFRDWDVYATIQNILLQSLKIENDEFLNKLRPRIPETPQKLPKRTRIAEQDIIYNKNLLSNLKELAVYKKINNPKKVKVPIYIWSCACATGEEPYSLAMIFNNLQESLPNFSKYEIIASDIDKFAIEAAKRGIYTEESIKYMSKYNEKRYFKKKTTVLGDQYHITNNIKKSITLLNEDITKIHLYSWKFDLIFCRNLLIYFNIENRNMFIRTLERQLNDGGILVLGKAESLFEKEGSLKLIDPTNHIYVKDRFDKIQI